MVLRMRRLPKPSRPGSGAIGKNGMTARSSSWSTATRSVNQALGAAYAAHDLDMPVRYEVHLDRKLERTLAMLFRLREPRRPTVPGRSVW
jgi:hypothetical protein